MGTALAHSVPAKVLDMFSETELLWPQSLMPTTPMGVATSGSTLRFVEQSVPALRELQKVHPTVWHITPELPEVRLMCCK